MDELKYPTGHYQRPQEYSVTELEVWCQAISSLPERLGFMVENLDEDQLNKTYRDGGWTVSQLVHHLADSHMNGYMRYKLALTENNPTIRPYDEKAFAELTDGKGPRIDSSLTLLEGLHLRWFRSIKSLNEEDLRKELVHPEGNYPTKIYQVVALYAWHGDHHLGHIKLALK